METSNDQPLVTVVLLAYNQERFVAEAVNAALHQDYPNLQVVLSDDCSHDATFEIIKSVASAYAGQHQVVLNRNAVNLGLARHFNKAVAMGKGEIFVIAAGDDISLPGRVSRTVDIFRDYPGATIVSFRAGVIDADGNRQVAAKRKQRSHLLSVTLEDYLAGRGPRLSGASRGFKRVIFDTFGDLEDACPTEDTPYILRGLMMGYAVASPEEGILYRKHGGNLSASQSLHRMNFYEVKSQYDRDADVAVSLGLISEDTRRAIGAWTDRYYKKRLLRSGLYNSTNRLSFVMRNIIFNSELGIWERIKFMRKI